MKIGFNWEIYFDLPPWIEKVHDYVWSEDDDDNVE